MGLIAVDWAGSLSVVVAVDLIISVVVVVVGIVGIGIAIDILIQRVIASRIKPARILAFSSFKSMRCGGTVMGWDGGCVARVGSVRGNGGVAVVGVIVDIVGCGDIIWKSSSKSSSISVGNVVSSGALRVRADAGGLPIGIFLVVSVFEIVLFVVVISGSVVVSVVNCVFGKSCHSRARKWVSSTSRSWLAGGGARGGRGGGGVVVLVAAGGEFVVVCLVVAGSRSVWL